MALSNSNSYRTPYGVSTRPISERAKAGSGYVTPEQAFEGGYIEGKGGLSKDNLIAINQGIQKEGGINQQLKEQLIKRGYSVSDEVPVLSSVRTTQTTQQQNYMAPTTSPALAPTTQRTGFPFFPMRTQATSIPAKRVGVSSVDYVGEKGGGYETTYYEYVTQETTAPAEPPRTYSLKDVSFKRTFLGGNPEQYGDKINLQTYVVQKGNVLFNKASDKVGGYVPVNLGFNSRGFNLQGQGIPVKEVLFDYKVNASPTGIILDTAKFGFFYPNMQTGQQALASAIQRGDITPVTETEFKSLVTQRNNLYDVKTASVSKSGGLKVVGVSRQIVKDYSDDISVGLGKGVSASRVGYTSKVNYNLYNVAGVNKNLGAKNIGTGVKGASISEDFLRITQRRGLGGISSYKNIAPNLKANFNYGAVKITRQFDNTKIIGVINRLNVDDEVYGFIGTTNKPITRISTSGISYRISPGDINVRGIIKYGNVDKVVYFGEETRQGLLSNVAQTPVLTEQLKSNIASSSLNAVTKNINTLNLVRATDISRTTAGYSTKPITSITQITNLKLETPIIKTQTPSNTGSRFADMTGSSAYADYTGNKFNNLGVLDTKFDTGIKQITKVEQGFNFKSVSGSIQKSNQGSGSSQKNILETGQGTQQKSLLNLNTGSITKQNQRLRTGLILKQKLKFGRQTMGNTPRINFKFPKPEYPKIAFKYPKGKNQRQTFGKVPVYGRRFGKWGVIGRGSSEREAFNIGKLWASKNLGVSFRVPSAKSRKVTGFQTKIRQGIPTYIEPRGKRLKRGTQEVPEINFYKNLMPKINKKKKRRFSLW